MIPLLSEVKTTKTVCWLAFVSTLLVSQEVAILHFGGKQFLELVNFLLRRGQFLL
jgi:hypothetical protein